MNFILQFKTDLVCQSCKQSHHGDVWFPNWYIYTLLLYKYFYKKC